MDLLVFLLRVGTNRAYCDRIFSMEQAAAQPSVATEGLSANCDKRRVLLVDDQTSILDVFRRLIKYDMPHCRVETATNGLEAVNTFRQYRHGVIVLDLHMPVMDGATAFLEIQKWCQANHCEMPSIVFCTGYDPPELLKSILTPDSSHCLLMKPVTNQIFLETLRQRLEQPVAASLS